jgi:DNA-binding LytR/AlgR family response regulator
MTIRAIVVDDEPLARDELVFLLREAEGVEVIGTGANAEQAIELLEKEDPDAAFVDLRMPGPDGIALAEALVRRKSSLAVVIVSAHDDGALRAFEAKVLDYLLKPVRLERLRQTLDRIRDKIPAREDEGMLTRLAVKRRGQFVIVDLDDVVYFEMKDELVWAVTKEDRFSLDLSLGAVEQRIPVDRFFRCHRGYIVRLDRIQAMEPAGAGTYDLIVDHPTAPRIPLARERVRSLRQLIPVLG